MSEIRTRFVSDMYLAGYAESTQKNFINTVRKFIRWTGNVPPEKITESQVVAYIRYMLDEKKVARGTFISEFAALHFLFCNTLLRDWPIFTKKKFASRFSSDCRSRRAMPIAAR